jgi:hypothetical protein
MVFESNKYDFENMVIENNNTALNAKRNKRVKYGPKSGMLKTPAINADDQIKLNNITKKGAISFSRKCFIIDNFSHFMNFDYDTMRPILMPLFPSQDILHLSIIFVNILEYFQKSCPKFRITFGCI